MTDAASGQLPGAAEPYADKWKAFSAIAVAFVTMVFSMTMVFVALSSIAEDFGVTLRAVSWVVIVQSLVISALMMPLGRVADVVGRRKVHMVGLVLFAVGSLAVGLAPTFGLMITARVLMSVGNAMVQAVGTAMIVTVFPPEERGKALGSQTSVVAIGAAMGPIGAGLVLQVLPWQALFFLLVPPLAIAFVAARRYLDEAVVSGAGGEQAVPAGSVYDWGGATLSALAITVLVLVVSNPLAMSWTSAPILVGWVVMVGLFAGFIRWELGRPAPMLQLEFFRSAVFSMAVTARTLGFVGTTAVMLLMPVFLISVRGLSEGLTGAAMFLMSLGMGITANRVGPQSDRFGERPIFIVGFSVALASLVGLTFVTSSTPMWLVMVLLFVSGVSLSLWNVPNGSTILGAVPRRHLGVVGAFMNLTRNIGNVIGQALASAIVVGVMASRGFDIPLSDIASTPGAAAAFLDGWRIAYVVFVAMAVVALVLALLTRPHVEIEATVEEAVAD